MSSPMGADQKRFNPQTSTQAGFLQGVVHGVILPVSFGSTLINDQYGIYDVYNDGIGYDLGFLIGVLLLFGGGGRGSKSSKDG